TGTLDFVKEVVDLTFLPKNNAFVLDASIIIIINGIPINLFNKYGERGYRYLLLQAGHLGQNISLYCKEEKLNTCPIGGFYDDILSNALSLPKYEWPIYLYAVGGKPSD
ncbi:nitroreductase family protein, partial [Mycobacterium tuberculosis]|uniref:nitroreductase family protein n=1 Tax=Mycobacterium tuberculosis TaxID=1773 RepID=UPI0011153A36